MPSIKINGQEVLAFISIHITEGLSDEQVAVLQAHESVNDAYNHCRYFTVEPKRLMWEWQRYGTYPLREMPASAWFVGIITQAVEQDVTSIVFEDQCYHDLQEYIAETEAQRRSEAALEHTEIERGVYPEYVDRRVQVSGDDGDLPF